MSRRGIVNAVVALAAILVTGGLATRAVVRGPVSEDRSMIAAAVDGRDTVDAQSQSAPAATAAPIPTRPAKTTTTRTPTPTTPTTVASPVPPPTVAPTAPVTAPPPPPLPLPVLPPTTSSTPPPSVVQTSPSSWRLVANGVTMTASIEPAAPRVGDTVTISYTTEGEGDFCCMVFVYVDGAIVGETRIPAGPCPVPPVTSGSTSIVVEDAGPLAFQVQATRIEHLCFAPPSFATANLHATFTVLPAAEA